MSKPLTTLELADQIHRRIVVYFGQDAENSKWREFEDALVAFVGYQQADARLEALEGGDIRTCKRCSQSKECLLIETGFAGERELMCAECLSEERALAKAALEQVRADELERCVKIIEFHGHKRMANALRETLP
jgi:hypothetical protein